MTKRLTLAILGALTLIVGLVAGPAIAGDPYPGTVRTTTNVSAPDSIKAGNSAAIKVSVETRGTGQADGTVKISVKGPGGFDASTTKSYNGGKIVWDTPQLKKPGTYKVTAIFNGGDSVFKNSNDSTSITVKKKKRN